MSEALVNSAAYKADQAAKNAKFKAAAEAVFQGHAHTVFLEYHEKASWAERKVSAGLRLTPEAVEYMEREIAARKLAAEARARNLEIENAAHAETTSADDSEPAGNGAGNGASGDDAVSG